MRPCDTIDIVNRLEVIPMTVICPNIVMSYFCLLIIFAIVLFLGRLLLGQMYLVLKKKTVVMIVRGTV